MNQGLNYESIVSKLKMTPHPEGGYFTETYRCADSVMLGHHKHRSCSTSIYFLMPVSEVSHFHRLSSDEIWHFHQGDCITVVMLTPGHGVQKKLVGPVGYEDAMPQVMIPKGTWFGALHEGKSLHGYSLVGCTVAPGFDFADFQLATRIQLLTEFHSADASTKEWIHKLTKP